METPAELRRARAAALRELNETILQRRRVPLEVRFGAVDALSQCTGESPAYPTDLRRELRVVAHDSLRRGRGCRGADVRDEIADRDIHLMAHGGDHRHRTRRNRARDALVV